MKRGDIVIAQQRGTATSKARPCVVVQNDAALDNHPLISICPLTSFLIEDDFIRPTIVPSETNGLRRVCQVEIDQVQPIRRGSIGDTIGALAEVDVRRVDAALRRWLDL